MLKDETVNVPPFPQNKSLWFSNTVIVGTHTFVDYLYAVLIPVLNQPLSSNQYYIIKSRGNQKGLAYASSKEEDRSWLGVADAPPQVFDPRNAYQQFEISNNTFCGKPNGFVAKSVAPDGVPPYFLTRKGWRGYTKTLENFKPTEALGLDAARRARLPELTFSLPTKSSDPVMVGKWYCPFIFIREGAVDTQMSNSTYYEMTLEQNWEKIFESQNEREAGNGVEVDVSVHRQVALVAGSAAERMVVADEVMWFAPFEVGLSSAIVERVKWEQERGGFRWERNEEQERVRRREEFGGTGRWRRFGCYVLVERFVLKRMDGRLVLTWEFRHTHQIRTKWE